MDSQSSQTPAIHSPAVPQSVQATSSSSLVGHPRPASSQPAGQSPQKRQRLEPSIAPRAPGHRVVGWSYCCYGGSRVVRIHLSNGAEAQYRCNQDDKACFEMTYGSIWPEEIMLENEGDVAFKQLYGTRRELIELSTDPYLSKMTDGVRGDPIITKKELFQRINQAHRVRVTSVVPQLPVKDAVDADRLTVKLGMIRGNKGTCVSFIDMAYCLDYLGITPSQVVSVGFQRGLSSGDTTPLPALQIAFKLEPSGAVVTAESSIMNRIDYGGWSLAQGNSTGHFFSKDQVQSIEMAVIDGEDVRFTNHMQARKEFAVQQNDILAGNVQMASDIATTSPNALSQTSLLLQLPHEIAKTIYEYVLETQSKDGTVRRLLGADPTSRTRIHSAPVLQVCRQIYFTALPVLYRTFRLEVDLPTDYHGSYCAEYDPTTPPSGLDPNEGFRFIYGYGNALLDLAKLSPFALQCIGYITIDLGSQFISKTYYEKDWALRYTDDEVLKSIVTRIATIHDRHQPLKKLEVFGRDKLQPMLVKGKRDADFINKLKQIKTLELIMPSVGEHPSRENKIQDKLRGELKQQMEVADISRRGDYKPPVVRMSRVDRSWGTS